MTEPDSLAFVGANKVRWRNRKLLYFSGCDYFRLARDPRLAQAAVSTLKKAGLNVAASRSTTGNHQIYPDLELALARFFLAESALVLPDGYLAPLVAAQAIADEFTHALVDEFAHAALLDAARTFSAPPKTFKHRDPASLRKVLGRLGPDARPIVLTDGMFAHDGSVAPLKEYLRILPQRGLILVDDAHGAGVLGATGGGSLEFAAVGRQRIIQCATLSKAFGAYGGVVLGSKALREKILARSRAFVGTTPLPPPLAGAALAALRILRDEPARRERLFENANYLRIRLRRAGWEISETPGPIVRLPSLTEKQTGQLKTRLLAAGIYPPFLKYGKTATQGAFRIVVSSEHTRGELNQLIAAIQPYNFIPSIKGESAQMDLNR